MNLKKRDLKFKSYYYFMNISISITWRYGGESAFPSQDPQNKCTFNGTEKHKKHLLNLKS